MFLTLIWSKSGWPNFLLKLAFFAMMIYGIVLSLSFAGLVGKF